MNSSKKHNFCFGENFLANRNFYTSVLHSEQFPPTKQKRGSRWLTFPQQFIVPILSCYTVIEYPTQKNDFLRLNLFAINIFIQVSSWLAFHSQTISFPLNITDLMLKMRLLHHLKHTFALTERGNLEALQSWLTNFLPTF